jgi:hypothetical protein
MPIPRPHYSRNHPGRFDACQLVIEDKLIELIGQASDVAGTETKYCRPLSRLPTICP